MDEGMRKWMKYGEMDEGVRRYGEMNEGMRKWMKV